MTQQRYHGLYSPRMKLSETLLTLSILIMCFYIDSFEWNNATERSV
jgi:hypothetical protein